MHYLQENATKLASLVLALALWEVSARLIQASGLPPASEVLPFLVELVASGEAFGPLGSTLFRTTMGFLLGFTLGIAYGVFVFLSRTFDDLSRGLFQIAVFTPTLILIFLSLVALGRTNLTVILVIGFVVTTAVGIYMRDALQDFDVDLIGMATSYKTTLWQRVRGMYLPFLIPAMLAAGRIGFTLAWKVAFLSEVFGFSEGLGWQVRNSYTIYDMTALLAWLTLFVVTLLLIEQLIRLTERTVVKW